MEKARSNNRAAPPRNRLITILADKNRRRVKED